MAFHDLVEMFNAEQIVTPKIIDVAATLENLGVMHEYNVSLEEISAELIVAFTSTSVTLRLAAIF